MVILAGLHDRTLVEKAMAESYDLERIIEVAINLENSKDNAHVLRVGACHVVSRM